MRYKSCFSALLAALVMAPSIASADFVVVDKSLLASPEVPSLNSNQWPVIEGYGNDVVLGDLLQEIVPSDWIVTSGEGLSELKVNWKGGSNWFQILRQVGRDNKLEVIGSTEKRLLSIARASAASAKQGGTAMMKDVATNAPASKVNAKAPVKPVVMGSIEDTVSVNLRSKTLSQVLKVLAPTGWLIDSQVPDFLMEAMVDYTAERTTRKQALSEVLLPMGLAALPYPHMTPTPMIVIVKGGK